MTLVACTDGAQRNTLSSPFVRDNKRIIEMNWRTAPGVGVVCNLLYPGGISCEVCD